MSPRVVPYDPAWSQAFADEAAVIVGAVSGVLLDVHHIGSTSIPGMFAKPVIDMLGAAQTLVALDAASHRLEALGYQAMGAFGIEGRRYFRKDNAAGQRTHHLHVYEAGSPHIERHLAFRDYLRSHPGKAEEYAALKAQLVASAAPYQDGKDAFVKMIEAEALRARK